MTPKEQAIKKAYGDKYDILKDQMDENGWVEHCPGEEGHPRFRDLFGDKYELECIEGLPDYWRPASLRGLETNNGWISVEDRLPEESGVLHQWVSLKDGSIHFAKWQILLDNWEIPGIGIPSSGSVTHWQPVVRPEAPLY